MRYEIERTQEDGLQYRIEVFLNELKRIFARDNGLENSEGIPSPWRDMDKAYARLKLEVEEYNQMLVKTAKLSKSIRNRDRLLEAKVFIGSGGSHIWIHDVRDNKRCAILYFD